MMRILAVVLITLLFRTVSAQTSDYVFIENEDGNTISYPPETEFHLFDSSGNLVLSDDDLQDSFKILEKHVLLVQPNYKDGADKFVITSGVIAIKSQERSPAVTKTKNYGKYAGTLTATKEYFDSKIEGERNLVMVFDNKLVFRYFDGQARAWFDNEEVQVSDGYLVEIPSGIAKIDYDPTTGTVWWVFEQKK